MEENSNLMKLFRYLGFDSIAWSLRRIHCPVNKSDLVLEVGSGGSPYSRSNILCDPYEETSERHYSPLIADRPIVMAFAEELPFKDNAFDFVIASHVLEHSNNPQKFLSEMERVAKAGYIEVPDGFMERLTAYPFHKLEITKRENQLLIRKKKGQIHDDQIVTLFRNKAQNIFPYWAKKFPFHFHVRYYWSKETGGISYKIINPATKLNWSWKEPPIDDYLNKKNSLLIHLKKISLKIHRYLFSQKKINREINFLDLLKCPSCHSENFKKTTKNIICEDCNKEYKYKSGS